MISNKFQHPPRSTIPNNNNFYNRDFSLSNRATHNSNVTYGRYSNDNNSFRGNFNKKEMSLSNNRNTIYQAPTFYGKNSQHSSTSTSNCNDRMNISNNNRTMSVNDSTNNNLLTSKKINTSNDLNNINLSLIHI